jgi:hypothetical protein
MTTKTRTTKTRSRSANILEAWARDPCRTTLHRDGSVTVWDVFAQGWERTRKPSAKILASLGHDERERVLAHIARHKS